MPRHELPSNGIEHTVRLDRDVEFIRANYGIELAISANLTPEEIAIFEGEGLKIAPGKRREFTLVEKAHLARGIVREISKYPRQYVEHAEVEKIRVFRGVGGIRRDETYGLSVYKQRLTFLSTRDGFRQTSAGIHHEFFHHGDYVSNIGTERDVEDIWPIQVSQYYGQDIPLISIVASLPILPHTKKTKIEEEDDADEDRALLAEMIMVSSDWLREYLNDHHIAAKTAWALDAFRERSGGLMDDKFFLDLFTGRVHEGYWAQKTAGRKEEII